jgi:catechol 2,3-dioxygenase-like lactoylglutathione lyase family enzyme
MATTQLPKVKGVHHTAFRCRDAEETRHFYEDILGLKLAGGLSFESSPSGKGAFMHLFFEMADGNYIAFFDIPETVDEKTMYPKDGMEEYHIAMELDSMKELQQMRQHLSDSGVPVYGPIDHDFCHSIYFYDPNGVNLEFTIRDESHDEYMAKEQRESPEIMAKWAKRMNPVRAERLKGTEELRAKYAAKAKATADRINGNMEKLRAAGLKDKDNSPKAAAE